MIYMKTRTIKKSDVDRRWYLLDATDIRLGKLATKAAGLLIGKSRVNASVNLDVGDSVVIINSEKVSVFPKKLKQKKYYSHSGYIGSLKEETLGDYLKRKPEGVVKDAISGMLPKNKMRDKRLTRLFVYKGEAHKHEAQKPEVIKLNDY